MKRLLFILLLAASSIVSCSYVLEIEMPEFTPQVVLNSFICPDNSVAVDFYWSRSATDDKYNGINPPSGTATLFEDDVQVESQTINISDDENISSRATFDYLPTEGHSYSIVATIDNYGEVSAETYIPKSCTLTTEIVKQEKIEDFNYMNTAGIQFSVSDILKGDNIRSVWFYTYGCMTSPVTGAVNTIPTNYNILFCDNPYIDNVNRVEEVDLTGESIYLEYRTGDAMYYYTLRLSQSDIAKCTSFKIASEYIYEYESYDNDTKSDYLSHVRLVALSPSDDFDRYQKSAYQQAEGIYYFDMTPISFDEVRVYTNVKNGLGIFAGYSRRVVDMPVKNFSEEE